MNLNTLCRYRILFVCEPEIFNVRLQHRMGFNIQAWFKGGGTRGRQVAVEATQPMGMLSQQPTHFIFRPVVSSIELLRR
jgi:hypothetical protein